MQAGCAIETAADAGAAANARAKMANAAATAALNLLVMGIPPGSGASCASV